MSEIQQNMYDQVAAWLEKTLSRNGSDLILSANVEPHAKAHNKLEPLESEPVSEDSMHRIVDALLDDEHKLLYLKNKTLDFCLVFENVGPIRFNFYFQQRCPALVGRLIPIDPPDFEKLGLPQAIVPALDKRNGLILVTGPTGSGKTTTLAGVIHRLNYSQKYHILSLEDPVEYRHSNIRSVIEQIDIGEDAVSFAAALKASLRQAPDVIVVGELRDRESMEIALTLAETGHLVLATVHSRDTIQALTRIIDCFPAQQQGQISALLSQVLLAVVAQQLIPDATDQQMILAAELLLTSQSIQSLVREQKFSQMYSVLQSSGLEGMVTMNDSLSLLVGQGIINEEEALARTTRPKELLRLLNTKPKNRIRMK